MIGILPPSFILTSCFSFMGQRLNVHWLQQLLVASVTSCNFCHVLLSHALHGHNKAVRCFHCEATDTRKVRKTKIRAKHSSIMVLNFSPLA